VGGDGELRYFTAAQQIGDAMLARFCDSEAGDAMSRGFFDTEEDPAAIGALSARRKPLQDSPTPAGNASGGDAAAAAARADGQRALPRARYGHAGDLRRRGGALWAVCGELWAGAAAAIEPPVQVCVIGDDALADELMAAAMKRYAVNKSVIRLRREQLSALPPALAETLPHLPPGEGSVAVVCKGNSCLPPMQSAVELSCVAGADYCGVVAGSSGLGGLAGPGFCRISVCWLEEPKAIFPSRRRAGRGGGARA
jgi:uncharacterized protein YyaL (SSP411 family)